MAKRAVKGLKADLISRATGKGVEPEIKTLVPPTKIELARLLSAYSSENYDVNDYKKWSITWLKKHHPELVEAAEGMKPWAFVTYGALMRMHGRGLQFDDGMNKHLDAFLARVRSHVASANDDDEEEVKKKPRKTKVNAIAAAFDDELDEAMITKSTEVKFDIDPTHDPAPVIARCQEALDNFKVENIEQYPKHMKKWFKAVIEKLSNIQKIVKVRKPRKQRVRKVNPVKMTQKVKYLKSCPELKIDSKNAVDMVGKQKVYLYDTKYKKITKLVCAEGSGFVIKGTTIQNFDPDKSSVAFIRKPAQELKSNMGIRELDRVMNSTKSKRQQEPKGRINEYTLIMNIS